MKDVVWGRPRRHGRRKIFFVLAISCLCSTALMKGFWGPSEMSFDLSRIKLELKKDIVEKSRKYLEVLALEQDRIKDGPVSGYDTAYDLKKTVAVLLNSLIGRVEELEATILQRNPNRTEGDKVTFKDLLNGKQEECPLPSAKDVNYPDCVAKYTWMKTFWKSDPCYAKYGVDGSDCTILVYLSEVESHCPKMKWRPYTPPPTPTPAIAEPQLELENLFKLMEDNPVNFKWIKSRLTRTWPNWVRAYDLLSKKQAWTFKNLRKKKILLHLGFLTKESGFKFGEKSLKGGPLGELVQWTDLIAALYILGHHILISSEIKTFISFAQADPALKSSCPVLSSHHVDLIFTDIVGLKQMKKKIPGSLQNYKCRLRVLDSFGTQAEFNFQPYFLAHKSELGGKPKNVWGGHSLHLQQFYTMYPHSPDNTFLGFVVETFSGNATSPDEVVTMGRSQRENWALVYGKESYMWKGTKNYVDTVHSLVEVHGTVNDVGADVPNYVINHGLLNGPELHALLRKVKMFLGLGFPYEGPAPLEAIANGAVFINPKFTTPKGRKHDKFFEEKPTCRQLTSQNPYAEEFIGPPYVLTVDFANTSALTEAVKTALKSKIVPFLPYEFTAPGLLERVNALVDKQDFCGKFRNWPPFSAAQLILSEPGQSCKDACWKDGLICEPSYFPKINSKSSFQKFGQCEGDVSDENSVHVPARNSRSGECHLQGEQLLFSCASAPPSDFQRLCPCRDFIKDQAALCAACL